jgi:hypothetical protein
MQYRKNLEDGMKAKKVVCFLKFFCVIAAIALFLAGCVEAQNYRKFYYLDVRSFPVPVMVNEDLDAGAGRKITAVVSKESSVSTSTYGDYQVTTTRSAQTTQPFDYQLLANSLSGDNEIRIDQVSLFYHYLGMPYYSERYEEMVVDASYFRR